jgi:hypothetical protein
MKKSKGVISEKELDKIQDSIEKEAIKNIKIDYDKKPPIFISVLKVLLILSIIETIGYIIFYKYFPITEFIYYNLNYIIMFSILLISLQIALLFGLYERARWGWILGLIFFGAGIVASVLFFSFLSIIGGLIFFMLLLIHKDYFVKH